MFSWEKCKLHAELVTSQSQGTWRKTAINSSFHIVTEWRQGACTEVRRMNHYSIRESHLSMLVKKRGYDSSSSWNSSRKMADFGPNPWKQQWLSFVHDGTTMFWEFPHIGPLTCCCWMLDSREGTLSDGWYWPISTTQPETPSRHHKNTLGFGTLQNGPLLAHLLSCASPKKKKQTCH